MAEKPENMQESCDELRDDVYSGRDKYLVDKEQTELLQKLISQQKQNRVTGIVIAIAECVLLAVLIIVFSMLLPKFFQTVTRVEESMDQVDILVAQAESSLSEITVLARDADVLVRDNDEAITEAIEHFNSFDFDSLNRSISNIADIVEPVVEAVGEVRSLKELLTF